MPQNNPLSLLSNGLPFLLIDGAMATELENRGCQLADSLWSAKLLTENPQLIEQVHYDYYQAGAQCAITASYQASLPGFAARGISAADAQALMRLSVTLAANARHRFLSQHPDTGPLLIAGSVGPYGAWLADGSEYRGDYHLTPEQYQTFHRPRMAALLEAGADLLACETLPSFEEIRALAELLTEFPRAKAWFSFTLRDAQHLSDGTPLSEVIAFIECYPQIFATGINCIALAQTTDALRYLHSLTPLPLVVYPNSGEDYDAVSKCWHGHGESDATLAEYLPAWLEAGAKLIGGCCRTTPADITALRQLQTGNR